MKKILVLSFIVSFSNIFSQNIDNLNKEANGSVIMIRPNNSIKGNYYLYDEWNKGVLVFNGTVFYNQNYLQYDAYKSRILIKNKKNLDEVIQITDKSLTGFSIIEKNNNLKHNFVKLTYSNFKGKAEDGFYEIIFNVENTNYFIKKDKKVIYDPNKSKGSQTINNFPFEYRDKTVYFIKNKQGLYVTVKLRKRAILGVINEHPKLVNAFIKAKKVHFNNESEVCKLVNYYYTL